MTFGPFRSWGHKDVSTTMIYTHVLNRGGRGVYSPADSLGLVTSLIRACKNRLTIAAMFVGLRLDKIFLFNEQPNYRMRENNRTVMPR